MCDLVVDSEDTIKQVEISDVLKNRYPWITKDLLKTVIKEEYQHDIITEIKNFSLEQAVGRGENYSSDLLRVRVNYSVGFEDEEGNQSYIIKTGLENAEMEDILEKYDIFSREVIVFGDILPKIEDLLYAESDDTKFAPVCYAQTMKPNKYLIFEDLTKDGYVNVDRRVGLDYQHLKMVLTKLAKWHAASAVLYENENSIMKHHLPGNITKDVEHFYPLFKNSVISCADITKTWPGYDGYAKKLYKLEKCIIEKGCDIYTRDENGFNVLNHGDLWINNIMFKYNKENKPKDVLMIDFQAGYFGSPGIDLSYLLYTSCRLGIKEEEWDYLLQHYHLELKNTLIKLEYKKKIPNLVDIQIELLKKGMNGVMFSLFLIPIRLLEDVTNADLTCLLKNDETAKEFRETLFSAPKYKSYMTYLLDYYDRKGFLAEI